MASFISRIVFCLVAAACIIGVALAWMHWTDQSNTVRFDQLLNQEQVANLPPRDKAEKPVVIRLGQNRFALVNPTRFPVHYTGYPYHTIDPRPRAGEINPFYDKQFRDPAGAWKSNVGGWCGTGSSMLTIAPGQAGSFEVHTGVELPPDRKGEVERVGVAYWTGDPANAQTVWSEPFVP